MNRLNRQPRFLFLIPLLTLLVFISITISFIISFFWVKIVVVDASPLLFPDTAYLERRLNLLFISTSQLAQDIKSKYVLLQDVTVFKQFPSTLKISATAKTPLAQIRINNVQMLIVASGNVMPNISNYAYTFFPTIENCQVKLVATENKVNTPQIHYALSLLSVFSQKYSDVISSVRCSDDPEILELTTLTPKISVLITTHQSEDYVVSSLQFLLKQFRIEGNYPKTIDLRFEKPVIHGDVGSSDSANRP